MTEKRYTSVLLYALAFLLPALTTAVVFAVNGITPFGDGFISGWDCYTQYVDYYDWLRQVLTDGGNLFYSFGKSMGGNTFGLYAYYLASPLSLLIAFFPEGTTLAFMTIMAIIKIGFCGLTCAIFLSKRFSLRPTTVLLLCIGYALCDYVATFSICVIMWMDALVFLPLVMLGVYRWVASRKKALFLATAFVLVISCWYGAYMTFLFMIPYFLYEYFLHNGHVGARRFWKDFIVFGILMLVGVLLSAVMLLPVVYAQLAGVSEPFSAGLYQVYYPWDFPSAFFIGRADFSFIPEVCCGTAVLFAVVLFFFNKGITRSEKVATLLFLLVMFVSTYVMLFVEIWCGFRLTRGYYCRFAFLICFLMVFVAARSFETMQELPKRRVLIVGGVLFALALSQFNNYVSPRYLCIVLALIVAVTSCFLVYPRHRGAVTIALIVLTILELGINSYMMVDMYGGDTKVAQTYSNYRMKERSLQNRVDEGDSSFFRMEKTYSRLYPYFVWEPPTNEGMVEGYSQIESYSSCNDAQLDKFLSFMGYSRDDMGSSDYEQPILLSDSLLGIRYVAQKDGTVTENPYALPLGYAASENVLGAMPREYNEACSSYYSTTIANEERDPFAEQNAFVSMLLGEDVQCFKKLDVEKVVDSGADQEWTVDTAGHEYAYAYIDSAQLNHSTLTVGTDVLGEYNIWNSYYVFSVSGLDDGQTVKLQPESTTHPLWDQSLIAYYVDMDVFNAAMDKLRSGAFTPETVEDGYVHGTYHTDTDTLLFTTIPYDEGWSVYVDGRKVSYEKAVDTFIAIQLQPGDHDISMRFVPKGLCAGAAVSGVTLLGVVCVGLIRHRRKIHDGEMVEATPPPEAAS